MATMENSYIEEDIQRCKDDLKNAIDDLNADQLKDFYHNRSSAVTGQRQETITIRLEYTKFR